MVLVSAAALIGGLCLVAVLVFVGLGRGGPGASIRPAAVGLPVTTLIDGRSMGRADAPVTIDVWADFQCPVCERFATEIEPLLRAEPIAAGTVRLTYRDNAFIGPESLDAAVAARIADAQGGAFWRFHDLLYANQGPHENDGSFSRDRLGAMAASLGLDRSAFVAALDDPALVAAVRDETATGLGLGINQTPTLVVNGTIYTGLPDWTVLSTRIDELAAAAASPSPAASPAASVSPSPAGSPSPGVQ